MELRRTLKSLRLVKSLHQQNCRASKISTPIKTYAEKFCALLLFELGRISNCWLPPSLVDSVASSTCRPQVIWWLRPLCFYGWRLSRTVPACCTGTTCQNLCECQILCAHGNFHHFLWKIENSISASKCPIIALKIHTWSQSLSKFSYHTHKLLNGGHPQLWARLPGSGYNPVGGGVWGGGGLW